MNSRSHAPIALSSDDVSPSVGRGRRYWIVLLRGGLSLFLWAGMAAPSWSALEFESTVFAESAALGQQRVAFAFPFTNTGAETVEITAIRTSCGCTTSALDKKIYAPGESGVIEGNFSVGNRRGVQRNSVRVFTHDPATPAAELAVVVDIPQALTLRPGMALWRVGEEPAPKSVQVRPNRELGVSVESVELDAEDFSVELLSPGNPEDTYEILIAPRHTDAPARAMVRISVRVPDADPQTYFVHALIR